MFVHPCWAERYQRHLSQYVDLLLLEQEGHCHHALTVTSLGHRLPDESEQAVVPVIPSGTATTHFFQPVEDADIDRPPLRILPIKFLFCTTFGVNEPSGPRVSRSRVMKTPSYSMVSVHSFCPWLKGSTKTGRSHNRTPRRLPVFSSAKRVTSPDQTWLGWLLDLSSVWLVAAVISSSVSFMEAWKSCSAILTSC